jgi:hypothetical protein
LLVAVSGRTGSATVSETSEEMERVVTTLEGLVGIVFVGCSLTSAVAVETGIEVDVSPEALLAPEHPTRTPAKTIIIHRRTAKAYTGMTTRPGPIC